ncbi:hypothetical protein BASA81_003819 [Batrachochytrium salamandrivorans]|nr:hypothetical protein BASA81_003819 [Batrachochytrium salamandrivorans]
MHITSPSEFRRSVLTSRMNRNKSQFDPEADLGLDDHKLHPKASSSSSVALSSSSTANLFLQQIAHPRRNFWFLLSTLPVFLVLFVLPIQQEMEEFHKGRTSFQDRVAVLSSHPIDFVVKNGHQRWSIPIKYSHYRVNVPYSAKPSTNSQSSLSSVSTNEVNSASGNHHHCIRLFGANETMNADPNSRKNLPKIRHIRIIGERNSGTTLLRRDLQKMLRNTSVESGVTRQGYWFQDSGFDVPNRDEILVIHVVLEPYEWFARMQANPIHAPFHRKNPPAEFVSEPATNWSSTSFFKLPWTFPRPGWDNAAPENGHCQHKYPLASVIPCSSPKAAKANKMYPVYEMHPNRHIPFPTIVHLRTAKTFNFLNVSSWMPHVVHVRSRDISSMEGVNAFVTALLDRYRLSSMACEIHKRDLLKPHELGAYSASSLSNQEVSWEQNPPEPLTRWQIKFITCNLDWFMELELGFKPLEDPEEVCLNGYIHHPGKEKKGLLFRFMDGISKFGR